MQGVLHRHRGGGEALPRSLLQLTQDAQGYGPYEGGKAHHEPRRVGNTPGKKLGHARQPDLQVGGLEEIPLGNNAETFGAAIKIEGGEIGCG